MKKVKLMLLSLSVLAVVGTALAFKAKGSIKFCTAVYSETNGCPTKCPTLAETLTTQSPNVILCTTPPNATGEPCADAGVNKDCGPSAQFRIEEP